ncbi:hypothetical protein V1514DRAFT_351647 [Lipomyces japonicus]|uniref:uncharacterized protein n=1 Tax=Lipomyces japonicus TaxID=56871 RepID=UPI0034CF227E
MGSIQQLEVPVPQSGPPLYFTVIEDVTSSFQSTSKQSSASLPRARTFHPNVRYIFSDDHNDAEIISPAEESQRSRTIVVDFAEDGKTILSTTSLSPDWQIISAKTSSLAMRSSATNDNNSDIGQILNIEGIGFSKFAHKNVSKNSNRSTQTDENSAGGKLNMAQEYANLFAKMNEKFEMLLKNTSPQYYRQLAQGLRADTNFTVGYNELQTGEQDLKNTSHQSLRDLENDQQSSYSEHEQHSLDSKPGQMLAFEKSSSTEKYLSDTLRQSKDSNLFTTRDDSPSNDGEHQSVNDEPPSEPRQLTEQLDGPANEDDKLDPVVSDSPW